MFLKWLALASALALTGCASDAEWALDRLNRYNLSHDEQNKMLSKAFKDKEFSSQFVESFNRQLRTNQAEKLSCNGVNRLNSSVGKARIEVIWKKCI